jgi:hypothetical protein
VPVAEPGRVAEFESGLRWRVLFPELEHPAASGYLRELAASDCSPATLRSYAFDLLRWFRFLHRQYTPSERAERLEMVSSGVPLHIAATLLGHLNLDTTRGSTAVFPEEVIAAHRFFIERRRTRRPFGEMRPASGDEWDEFEQHFLLRKVALGDCHRPTEHRGCASMLAAGAGSCASTRPSCRASRR